MYSATPPENESDVRIGAAPGAGASRIRCVPAALRRAAVHGGEQAIRHARRQRACMLGLEHHAGRERECRARRRIAAPPPRSARCGRRRRSTTRRAPTSSAVTSTTLPSRHTAIFAVPPPTSTFMTVASSRIETRDRAGAVGREHRFQAVAGAHRHQLAGLARRTVRRSARALRRRTATPVRISAPVSISSGSTLASAYGRSMNAPSAAASISSVARIGREQDVGLVERLSLAHHVAACRAAPARRGRTPDARSTSRCRRRR